ncbi:hypothetical protein L6252_04025 [Candidatus Parcubacteria bacterium]|nr:hypothetical protein [Candidatus Parcubacteria bacterium]
MEDKFSKPINHIIRSTQLEVALRQLNVAIKLFFAESDQFAIYSLVRNAEEIISKLVKERNGQSLWDISLSLVKPEYKEEVRKFADDPRNDLKHRIHKENEKLVLNTILNDYFLLACVNAVHIYYLEEFKRNKDLLVFNMWFRTNFPQYFQQEEKYSFLEDKNLSKQDFYQKHVKIAKEWQVSRLPSFEKNK